MMYSLIVPADKHRWIKNPSALSYISLIRDKAQPRGRVVFAYLPQQYVLTTQAVYAHTALQLA